MTTTFKTISPVIASKSESFYIYQGNVDIKILKHKQTTTAFVQGVAENLLLESFQGTHNEKLQSLFGRTVVVERREIEDLTAIFDANFAAEQLRKDTTKTCLGILFSGYALIEKKTQTIIGRLSFEAGSEPGESVCTLVIGEAHRKKGYGKEAMALAAGLGLALCSQNAEIGSFGNRAPVKRFTASVLESDEKANSWLTSMGFSLMRFYKNEEGQSLCLYGVESREFSEMNKIMDLTKINWNINYISQSPVLKGKSPSPVSSGSSSNSK